MRFGTAERGRQDTVAAELGQPGERLHEPVPPAGDVVEMGAVLVTEEAPAQAGEQGPPVVRIAGVSVRVRGADLDANRVSTLERAPPPEVALQRGGSRLFGPEDELVHSPRLLLVTEPEGPAVAEGGLYPVPLGVVLFRRLHDERPVRASQRYRVVHERTGPQVVLPASQKAGVPPGLTPAQSTGDGEDDIFEGLLGFVVRQGARLLGVRPDLPADLELTGDVAAGSRRDAANQDRSPR